jgi:hypothetical protein
MRLELTSVVKDTLTLCSNLITGVGAKSLAAVAELFLDKDLPDHGSQPLCTVSKTSSTKSMRSFTLFGSTMLSKFVSSIRKRSNIYTLVCGRSWCGRFYTARHSFEVRQR